MNRLLVLALVTLAAPAARADESDDLLARQLAAVVRDPRLPVAQRIEATRTLGKLGLLAGAAVPDLTQQLNRLRDGEHERLQETIVDALGRIGSPARTALPAVARTAGRTIDIDLAIKRATDQILAASDSQDVGALTKQLQSRDASVRLRAVRALRDLGAAARFALPDLLAALNDPDPEVRRAAVNAVQTVQPDAPPSELVVRSVALDLTSPDAGIRLLAVRTLGRFGRRAGIVAESLQPLLADSDPDVRTAAAAALGRIAPP
ncbi:MAG: HEAT repeat domain-containing protein [Gemmataceae bacterium]|nr:HEAT repeat domain-containing protein [Gemmataceae bacterium]